MGRPVTHAHAGFVGLALMWQTMMTAMMAPVVWPWIRAFARIDGRPVAIGGFAAGYVAAWAAYSVTAAAIQVALNRFVLTASPAVAAVIFGVAGVYQVVPLKRACLTHCRNPLTYFLTRWRGGPAHGFRLGIAHGTFCVGCCWALMLIALVLGVMNVWWMAALAGVAFVEQVVPRGDMLRVPLGLALVSAAVIAVVS